MFELSVPDLYLVVKYFSNFDIRNHTKNTSNVNFVYFENTDLIWYFFVQRTIEALRTFRRFLLTMYWEIQTCEKEIYKDIVWKKESFAVIQSASVYKKVEICCSKLLVVALAINTYCRPPPFPNPQHTHELSNPPPTLTHHFVTANHCPTPTPSHLTCISTLLPLPLKVKKSIIKIKLIRAKQSW